MPEETAAADDPVLALPTGLYFLSLVADATKVKVRVAPAASGPPSPVRVSTTRHGATV